MEFIATQKFTRQSPRKVRLVANQVKTPDLSEVLRQLSVIERKSTLVLLKTIKQAMANAINNHGIAATDLELKSLEVSEGPRYRRFRAVSRGRAHGVIKRTCHVKAVVVTKSSLVKPAPETKAATNESSRAQSAATKSVKDAKETKTTKASKASKPEAAKTTRAASAKPRKTATKSTTKKKGS